MYSSDDCSTNFYFACCTHIVNIEDKNKYRFVMFTTNTRVAAFDEMQNNERNTANYVTNTGLDTATAIKSFGVYRIFMNAVCV